MITDRGHLYMRELIFLSDHIIVLCGVHAANCFKLLHHIFGELLSELGDYHYQWMGVVL